MKMLTRKLQKTLILILAVSLAFFTASCRNQKQLEDEEALRNETVAGELEVRLNAYKTDLFDSSNSIRTNAGIEKYLTNWAFEKGIECSADKTGNVVMNAKATEGYEDAPPVVLIAPYDCRQFATCADAIAMALYTVKNCGTHSDLTVIFAPENGHDFYGVRNLSGKFFPDDATVFVLNGSDKGRFSLNAAGCTVFSFTEKISRKKPEFTRAYRITMSGLESGQSDTEQTVGTNPVKSMHSLLENFKSSNIPYEIASISGGSKGQQAFTPDSCQMTIVVNGDKEEQFINKMEGNIESFNERNSKRLPDASYTYEEVELPETVISPEDGNRIVNFIYTLLDGTYYEDESGNIITTNNITGIQSTEDAVSIGSVCYSLDSEKLKEVEAAEETLCELSSAKFSKVRSVPVWNGPAEDSIFAERLKAAYRAYTKTGLSFRDSLISSGACFIQEKNPKCDMVTINVSSNVITDCTGSILKFLTGNTAENAADSEDEDAAGAEEEKQ